MQQPQEALVPINHPRISFTQTFASSLGQKPQRYGLDRSLARGIMQNNSNLILEQQKQAHIDDNITFNKQEEIARVVIQYQTKYNQVKNSSVQTQNRIKRYKEDIERLTQQHQKLIIEKVDVSLSLDQFGQNYEESIYQLQSIIMRCNSSLNMEERIKKDIIYYKKMIFQSNLSFMRKKSQVKRYDNSHQRQKKISLRCKTLLHSIDSSLLKNQSNRNFGIQKMQRILTQKQQFSLQQKVRQLKIHRSIIQGKNDKLQEQKIFIKLLYTNAVVKSILFYKMKRLMKQYKQLYDSFNIIKQNTSITTAEELVQRYLKRSQTYGILLSSISNCQPKIEDLKIQQQRLLSDMDIILADKLQIEEEYHKIRKEGENIDFKEIQKLNYKIQMINLYKHSWSNWAQQTQSSFRAVPKKQISSNYHSITPLIKDTLNAILKFLQKNEKEKSILQQAFDKQIKKSKLAPQDILNRNLRVKTLGNDQIKQEQEQQAQYDLVSEKDYMQMARRAVKKQFIMKRKHRYFK